MDTGIKGHCEIVVDATNTAKALGSGTLDVFATPAMISLIEKTAWTSVIKYLGEGQSTVGISLNITHDSATPVGMRVSCDTELVNIDRRRLDFKVEVTDEKGHVGGGTHSRFIVDDAKFLSKAESKHVSNCRPITIILGKTPVSSMSFDYSSIDIAVNNLVKKLSPKAIILFGSASNGTANDDSDIDLLVIMETELNKSDRFVLARGAVGRIGVPVDVLVFTPEEFSKESVKDGSIVVEALETGKTVYGEIQIRTDVFIFSNIMNAIARV